MSDKCVYCGSTISSSCSCWKAKSTSDFTDDGEIVLCEICQGENDMCCSHCISDKPKALLEEV
ncbi:hypothetical protein [Vibrio agarivorans]|uniref:hypothetical protein n=1 Tax=Vibrio agarivorans TaxID=153622 RepID=UPI00222E861B|nr:hypothetical protein [Vibrio agarivorans]MDN3659715.1 hypothetical protein [Vibrio agarivorans]